MLLIVTTATYMDKFLNVTGVCFTSSQCYCVILSACCQQNVEKLRLKHIVHHLILSDVFQGKSRAYMVQCTAVHLLWSCRWIDPVHT